MCKVKMFKTLVKQRLNLAVEEVIEIFERTIAEYEEQLCRSKEEHERREDGFRTSYIPSSDLQQVSVETREVEEDVPFKNQVEPTKPIKEEEDLWSSQFGEPDVTEFTWTGVHVKSEDDGQSAQLYPSQIKDKLNQDCDNIAQLSDMDDATSRSSDTDRSDGAKEHHKTKKKSKHRVTQHFDCPECGKTFTNKNVLKNHLVTHSGEKPFVCTVCDKRFSLKHHMKTHMRVHAEKPFYTCYFCDRRFPDEAAKNEHEKIHAEKPRDEQADDDAPLSDLECVMTQSSDTAHSDDGKEPSRKKMKFKVDATYDSESKLYICSGCDKTFTNKSVLRNHMVTHTGEKPFACSVCDKRFSFKQNMRRHMAIHTGEKPHSCSFCDKRFYDKFEMKRHMLTHTADKPFSCSVCAKTFSRSSHLRMHLNKHSAEKPSTSSSSGQLIPTEVDGDDVGPILMSETESSDDANEPSESNKNFVNDATQPADNKQFTCSVCAKTFAQKGSLKTHMLTHTGEKPFACPVCAKCFSIKQNMKRHMAIHTVFDFPHN
ncbi:gastrula zinc finger protein XlCGF57.1-like [Corythoichthys intestinalis]|uniref:gastrula zinc finger protein XlCGF57.1-like n=1 Tax=Corythoichthys intestinalis TaxID=161448 RepID=UPI0025A5130B|nr:gastrula zinc finger protein XlCGF57.1-like [Corythoichthys intestinalis]